MAEIRFFCAELYYACKIYGKLYKISTYISTAFPWTSLPFFYTQFFFAILSSSFCVLLPYFLCAPLKSPAAVLMHAIIHCKIYGRESSLISLHTLNERNELWCARVNVDLFQENDRGLVQKQFHFENENNKTRHAHKHTRTHFKIHQFRIFQCELQNLCSGCCCCEKEVPHPKKIYKVIRHFYREFVFFSAFA